MSWWNMGGMNPKYKDFIEEHPEKTMIGISWAFQWRFIVLVLILEIIFFVVIILLGLIFGGIFQQ